MKALHHAMVGGSPKSAPVYWRDLSFEPVVGQTPVTATYRYNESVVVWASCVRLQHMQLLPDGRMFWGERQFGGMVLASFDSGHHMEADHFTHSGDYLTCDSKVAGFDVNLRTALLEPQGRFGAWSVTNNGVRRFRLSTPFDLSTAVADSSAVQLTDYNVDAMAFSSDGTKLFYKNLTHYELRMRTMTTPFDVTTLAAQDSATVNLQQFYSGMTWRDFAFSPDGLNMVMTTGDGLGRVHRFHLLSPFDISTLVWDEQEVIASSDTWLDGVALNDDGSKLLLFNSTNNNDRFFMSYGL